MAAANDIPVTIYTDGSCLGNPGPGGWGYVLLWKDNRKEASEGFSLTTNNRMEIMAVIRALEALKSPQQVDLYTDSRYVRDAVEKGWLKSWQKNGWRTAAKKPVKNKDLWLELLPLLQTHSVRLHWVEGHSGHPENERCDDLARTAASGRNLKDDVGYPE